VEDLSSTKSRLTEFRCGHAQNEADEFSPHEGGLTLHEAGHLLYRDGEYAAALTCMERSAKRGNLWADRDTVVVNEAWEIAENALKGLAGDPAPQPNRKRLAHYGRRRLRWRAAALAAVVAAAVASVTVQLGVPVTTTATPEPSSAPQVKGNRLSSVILESQPDSSATPLTLTERTAARTTPAPSAGSSSPGIPLPTPAGSDKSPRVDTLATTRTELRAPNEKGGLSTAYVPRESPEQPSQRQVQWQTKPGSRFFAILQSSETAKCTWSFHGTSDSGTEYSSAEFDVAPGAAKKVEVPLRSSNTMTAVVTSDTPEDDCLMVDPRFEKPSKDQRGELGDGTPVPRPVSLREDSWIAGRIAATPSITPSEKRAAEPVPSASSADPAGSSPARHDP
jgi:hypothetical protein